MLDLPLHIPILFIATVLASLLFFIYAMRESNLGRKGIIMASFILIAWLSVQLFISLKGFYYTNTRSFPPRFTLLVVPPLLLIIFLFSTRRGRGFIDSLPLVPITFLSIVRIPVEITLYWLCLYKYVPELMTYNGRNFDLISGNTAPFIAYAIYRGVLKKWMILLWNVLALGLLLNIVVNAVLSAPLAFQQFAFDQPNVGLLYFPFVWLPSFIVPVVLFTHLVSIRRMLIKR
jgi:hypothetical protein